MAIKRVFTTTEKELVTNENQPALNENLHWHHCMYSKDPSTMRSLLEFQCISTTALNNGTVQFTFLVMRMAG